MSRRTFLRGVAITAATLPAAGAGAAAAAGAAATAAGEGASPGEPPRLLGPGPTPVVLHVNGREHKLLAEPRTTLLDALRDEMGLTGPKRVCDRGTCGACTVLAGDRPVYACSMLAVEAQGRRIETIEAIAGTEGALGTVAARFCEKDALMCGFCTPGFVVAGEAARRSGATPENLDALRAALDGNVCRCGTYVRVLEAVAAAAGTGRGSPERR